MKQWRDTNAVGVVVAVNSEFIWADIFASTGLFQKSGPSSCALMRPRRWSRPERNTIPARKPHRPFSTTCRAGTRSQKQNPAYIATLRLVEMASRYLG